MSKTQKIVEILLEGDAGAVARLVEALHTECLTGGALAFKRGERLLFRFGARGLEGCPEAGGIRKGRRIRPRKGGCSQRKMES